MPQVLVNIGGRSYRLACNPGEEEHLARLAKLVDGKIAEMQGAFRDIADQRIVVMAALSIADELFDAKRKAEARAARIRRGAGEEVGGAPGRAGPRRRARSRHRRDGGARRGADETLSAPAAD